MNNAAFRCDCVELTRNIKDEIDAEIVNMNKYEFLEYLRNARSEFDTLLKKEVLERV